MSDEIVRPAQLQIDGWSPDCGNHGALADEPALAVRNLGQVEALRGKMLTACRAIC